MQRERPKTPAKRGSINKRLERKFAFVSMNAVGSPYTISIPDIVKVSRKKSLRKKEFSKKMEFFQENFILLYEKVFAKVLYSTQYQQHSHRVKSLIYVLLLLLESKAILIDFLFICLFFFSPLSFFLCRKNISYSETLINKHVE